MATARSFLNNDEVNQIRIKETQNRLLKSNLMAETTNQETLRLIPRISEFVEVIQSTRDAFKHLMKTKVTHNEIFTDEVKDSIRLTSSLTEKFGDRSQERGVRGCRMAGRKNSLQLLEVVVVVVVAVV